MLGEAMIVYKQCREPITISSILPSLSLFPVGFDDAVKVLFYYKSFNRVAARHDRALVRKN